MNLVGLFFRLPFWTYFILAAGVGYLTYLFYSDSVADAAARSNALADGPPEMVLIEDFDAATNLNDANEFVLRAQLDDTMAYELTREKNGDVKDRAFMVPLYATTAANTESAPLGLLFEKDDDFKFQELTAKVVDAGPFGPIVEINGVTTYLGKMKDNVSGAFTQQSRAYTPGTIAFDPFRQDRTIALSAEKRGGMLATYLFLAATLFCLGIGIYKLSRRRGRASRGRYG